MNIEIDPHTQAIVETVERVLAQREAALLAAAVSEQQAESPEA